ncbi:caveolin-2 [Nothoprocta perdicaria]|uniref:Caveolin n=1 Tax=Nothoprocta perdicaria TaxID=30464 RepID=A0A8C6ZVS2_NOTPE|nr:caveolin-2 [Nothoprocta perdicaria]
MGLEKEKAETRIFMDDDNLSRAGGPALSDVEKSAEDGADRDPNGLNGHLQLGFEDVIAEPELTHSFDKVWICSHALFELSKYLVYKLVTLLLAIPMALVAGIIFAALSCLHIWIVVPFVKTCLMVLPSVKTVWKSLTDVFIVPFFHSIGRCFAMVNIHLDRE